MAIGVSYDEFWFGDFTRLKYYVEAHKKQREIRNEELWLQGFYIDCALQTNFANFGKSLSGKTGGKQYKYLEKPIDIFPKSKTKQEIEDEKYREQLVKYFNSLIDKQNARKAAEARRKLEQGETNGTDR